VSETPTEPSIVDESTLILGIETSCDETAAALVLGGSDVVSSVVSTQTDLHADFGGVVPEIASRSHLEVLNPTIARAIVEAGVDEERIDAVACTIGPGLIGALLVGVSAAKALAMAWDVPFVGVNHMEAHLYAASLEDPTLEFPLVVLLVSGGHTMLVEMQDHGRYRCSSARRSTTPPVRRSTRWRGSSTSAIRVARRSTVRRSTATPRRSGSRGRS
jgi:N6-L-threonylcarbamoyladenine synthase